MPRSSFLGFALSLLVALVAFQACSAKGTNGAGGSGGDGGDSYTTWGPTGDVNGPSSTGPGNGGSTGTSSGGSDCDKLCEKASAEGCGMPNCVSDCKAAKDVPPACAPKFQAVVACAAASGTVACKDGKPQIGGCDAETQALLTCVTGGTGAGGGSGDGCYDGKGACNPLVPGGCAAGEACDLDRTGQFQCFPPPNTVQVGGTCDAANGPYCVSGATCAQGKCAAYCCNDADCNGMTCASITMVGNTDVKVCGP